MSLTHNPMEAPPGLSNNPHRIPSNQSKPFPAMASGNLDDAHISHATFDLATTAMAYISPGGSFIKVNRALSSLFGFLEHEFPEMTFRDLFPLEHRSSAVSRLKALTENQRGPIIWERRCRTRSGSTFNCRMALTKPDFGNDAPTHLLAEFQGFPTRKAKSRPGASDMVQSVLDSMIDGVVVADDEGRVMLYNPVAYDLIGLELIQPKPEEWNEIFGFFYPDGAAPYPAEQLPLNRAIRGESVRGAELGARRKDATEQILIRANAMPLRDAEGHVHGGVVVFSDITERKLSDEALEVQSEALKNLAEGVNLTDKDGVIRFANPALEDMFGYTHGELTGQHSSVLNIHASEEQDRLVAEQAAKLKKKGAWRGEMSNRHKDGRIFTTLTSISKLDVSGSTYWISVQEDITERKRTEEALRQSEERFAKIFRSSPAAIFISALDTGIIIDMNDSCLAWLGYQRHEVIGHTTLDLSLWHDYADREEIVDRLSDERAIAGIEKTFCTKSREERDALISAELIDLSGEPCVVWITYDITERKRADERIKNSLREKEVLLQEIHHRVKNNLQVISSLLNLQSGYIKDEVIRELFRESQDRVKSMALIHEKLYKSTDLARINFSEYVHSLTQMLFQSYRATRGEIQLKSQVEPVFLDIDTAVPVGLMLNELVSNSLKHAFPSGGPGTIFIDLEPRSDDEYILSIRDNGVGVPDDFDVETSNSLGLRLVKILTKQIGGTLKFRSEDETEFKIQFQDNENEGAAARTI